MTALPTFNAGTVPTAAQWQTLLPIKAIKGSDQIVNNSATLVNDSALFLTLAANAIYDFKLRIVYNSGATPAFKTAITLPAGATLFSTMAFFISGAWGFFSSTNLATSMQGTGADIPCIVWGEITTAGTAGNFQIQWAQNVANASNTIMRAGSSLIARQIG